MSFSTPVFRPGLLIGRNNTSVNSSRAETPPPHPPTGLLQGICSSCQSREWGICKFCTARRPGICQLQGYSRAFDTHAVSYQNITTQKVLQQKKQIGASVKDRNKLKLKRQVLDFMPAFLPCLSSHNYIRKSGAIDVN